MVNVVGISVWLVKFGVVDVVGSGLIKVEVVDVVGSVVVVLSVVKLTSLHWHW